MLTRQLKLRGEGQTGDLNVESQDELRPPRPPDEMSITEQYLGFWRVYLGGRVRFTGLSEISILRYSSTTMHSIGGLDF